MKIKKTEKKGNLVRLEVEAEVELLKSKQEAALQEAMQQVKIPGFRKGKAPRALVERTVDQEYIKSRSLQDVISDLYPQIIKEAKLEPIDYPNISILSHAEGQPVVFAVEVEVYPEVKLGKYKGIKANKKSDQVTGAEVESALNTLRDRFARFEEKKEGVVENGDLVEVDMIAQKAGMQVASLTRNDVRLMVGKGSIALEFDHEIKGLRVGGEKTFTVTFDSNYPVPEVAGSGVDFEVKINKISKKETIPLDDAFAKMVGRFNTLEELKNQLQANLAAEKKQAVEAGLRNSLIESILKETVLEVPQAMVEREVDIMLDEMSHNLSHSNLTLESYLKSMRREESDLKKELRAPAQARAKAKIVLRAISKQEKIEPEEKEVEAEISKMAVEAGKTLGEFKETLTEDSRQFIKDYLARQKALDFVVEKAKIVEEKE